jgi:hypothetical protein
LRFKLQVWNRFQISLFLSIHRHSNVCYCRRYYTPLRNCRELYCHRRRVQCRISRRYGSHKSQLTLGIYIDAPRSARVQSLSDQFSTSAVLSGVSLSLPPGPYFLTNSDCTLSFYRAFRLYSDTQRVSDLCAGLTTRPFCMERLWEMTATLLLPLLRFLGPALLTKLKPSQSLRDYITLQRPTNHWQATELVSKHAPLQKTSLTERISMT